jgi:predicted MPP superfamily phosphohydrolase
MVDATNSLKPDLIVMTGDLIDASICNSKALCDSLSKLNAKHGVLAITGNHDFYSGIETFMSIAADTHMKVLRNENTTIAGAVQVAGIDDPEAKSFHEGERNISKALEYPRKIDHSKPLILLSHRPDVFKEAAAKDVDIMLSGHTHWGQVPPMDLLVWITMKYSWGFYRLGDSILYTTSGTGTWGPPMRLFSRPEIVKLVLRKTNQ